MDFDSDNKAIIENGPFSRDIIITHTTESAPVTETLRGIFQKTFRMIPNQGAPVQSQWPRITLVESSILDAFGVDIDDTPRAWVIEVGDDSYNVKDAKPDGEGVVHMELVIA